MLLLRMWLKRKYIIFILKPFFFRSLVLQFCIELNWIGIYIPLKLQCKTTIILYNKYNNNNNYYYYYINNNNVCLTLSKNMSTPFGQDSLIAASRDSTVL